MYQNLSDYHYQRLLESADNQKRELEQYKEVNVYLRLNDWLFISPLFFQGYELGIFYTLRKSGINSKKKILQIIAKKFYDLRRTASFTEGYCVRCAYIKQFARSIENSIILTFQRDYEGSIKTLIPIIEGIIRQYLIAEKGYKTDTIRLKDLKTCFDFLKTDLKENARSSLASAKTENNTPLNFSERQIETLLMAEIEYFDTWFSFAEDFARNSFYRNTKGQPLTTEVNRHAILHEFGEDFSYSFENYIKVYFLLQFLCWAFLIKEGKSPFNEIENWRYFAKAAAYEQIILQSKKLHYEKHLLLKELDGYDDTFLTEKFPSFNNDTLPKLRMLLYKLLRKYDRWTWRVFKSKN